MSGIAGILGAGRPVEFIRAQAMGQALAHRGTSQEEWHESPELAVAARWEGAPPVSFTARNEGSTIVVWCDGCLYDLDQERERLRAAGHNFTSDDDHEVLPHLWEEHGPGMFERLRGQFALALWDERRKKLVLARDRFGAKPLHFARLGDAFLFASEIKGILASGLITPAADLRGINQLFTFFSLPGPVTCFEGISSVRPGHYLEIDLANFAVRAHKYWDLDFPAAGDEVRGPSEAALVDELEALLVKAVARCLGAPGPVGAYLSSGVDSGVLAALAGKVLGRPIDTFSVGLGDTGFDETGDIDLVASRLGKPTHVLPCRLSDVMATFPRLIAAAEGPVVDSACTSLLLLAGQARDHGCRAVLTGEGADEWLASHPWFRLSKVFGWLDCVPGVPLSLAVKRFFLRLTGAPLFPRATMRRALAAVGGPNAWLDAFGLIGTSKLRFFGPKMRAVMSEHFPYDDLDLDLERMRRWHPLNRSLYVGAKVTMPGLLLSGKGDRLAMQAALQLRYPFLDDDVVAFLARLHPRWKLHGFTGKYLLRRLADRYLPRKIAWRRKGLFMAPFEKFQGEGLPDFIDQLLSSESLERTGYFDAKAVQTWRLQFPSLKRGSFLRSSVELGLVAVFATQLWHHQFIDAELCDLPGVTSAGQSVPA